MGGWARLSTFHFSRRADGDSLTQVLSQAPMTRVVEEKRVTGLSTMDKPFARSNDIHAGGMVLWVLLIIGEDEHVGRGKVILPGDKLADVMDIVDAA